MSLPLPTRLGLIAALGSIVLLGGAYWFQYFVGLAPCEMCLWQRYPHMLAILFGLLTLPLMRAERMAQLFAALAILALFVTAGIGVFHAGVEYHLWDGPQACSGRIPTGLSNEELKKILLGARMVRCDEAAWKLWGISMAGWNAILSGGLAVLLAAGLIRHTRTYP